MDDARLPWWDDRLGYPGDRSPRVRDYRRLQSRWREVELGLPPGSYTDRRGETRMLGSRLPEGSGPEHQLLSEEAVEYALGRIPQLEAEGGRAEPGRLWLNMLSSQPLCFSVFGHLAAFPEAGARVLDSVLPWAVDHVDSVLVEHAPAPAALRLGGDRPDRTAFDAMVTVTSGSEGVLLGVETKYTEPFTQRRYDKPSYHHVCSRPDAWFRPGVGPAAAAPSTNQLWRNLMLAQESGRALGRSSAVVVLTAAGDRGAARAVTGVRPLLKTPDVHLAHVTLEALADAALDEPLLRDWAGRLRSRYLDLSLAATPGDTSPPSR